MTSVEDKVRKVNLERRPQRPFPESRSPQALPETPDAAVAGKLKTLLDGQWE